MPPLWRDGREAEGAPLLREYRVKSLIEGSNPSLSAIYLSAKHFLNTPKLFQRSRELFNNFCSQHSRGWQVIGICQ